VLADPARAAEWRRRFETPAEDADAYAGLLLKDALASHEGLVLFATSRPERIAAAVEAARRTDADDVARFREFLQRTGLRAAA